MKNKNNWRRWLWAFAIIAVGIIIIATSDSFQECMQAKEKSGTDQNLKKGMAYLSMCRWYLDCSASFFEKNGHGITAAFTIVLAISTILLWGATRDAAVGAERSASIAERHLNMSERPWVGITDIKFPSPVTIRDGSNLNVDFVLNNVGKVPAFNVDLRATFHPMPQTAWDEFQAIRDNELLRRPMEENGGQAMFPNQPSEFKRGFQVTAEHIGRAQGGGMWPTLTVIINYRSPVSGEFYCAAYLVEIMKIEAGRMVTLPVGVKVAADDLRYGFGPLGTYLN